MPLLAVFEMEVETYVGLLRALGDMLTIKYFLVLGKVQGPNFVFVLYPILIVFFGWFLVLYI